MAKPSEDHQSFADSFIWRLQEIERVFPSVGTATLTSQKHHRMFRKVPKQDHPKLTVLMRLMRRHE